MKNTGIKIIKKLQQAGYEAVFAGGCVRDKLMGIEPYDWDIATSAKPDEVEQLFGKTIPIGKAFGVINVIENNFQFEVATFRTDINCNGRWPDQVVFGSMEQDALRRDFTINGMFWDPIADRVFDFVNGQEDIKNEVIRFIGSPEDRIQEDNLRMLRALRFADRFSFTIDIKSFEAIKRNSFKIKRISKERIQQEMVKVFTRSTGVLFFDHLISTYLGIFIIPELFLLVYECPQDEQYHPEGNGYIHTRAVLKNLLEANYKVRIAGLLHDIGKPLTYKLVNNKITNHGHAELGFEMSTMILEQLKFSNNDVNYIANLVKDHMKIKDVALMKKSTFKRLANQPYFIDLLKLCKADCLASSGDLSDYTTVLNRYNELSNAPILPTPYINGKILIEMGFEEGPEIGQIKQLIYNEQLEGTISCFEEAIELAKQLYTKKKNCG